MWKLSGSSGKHGDYGQTIGSSDASPKSSSGIMGFLHRRGADQKRSRPTSLSNQGDSRQYPGANIVSTSKTPRYGLLTVPEMPEEDCGLSTSSDRGTNSERVSNQPRPVSNQFDLVVTPDGSRRQSSNSAKSGSPNDSTEPLPSVETGYITIGHVSPAPSSGSRLLPYSPSQSQQSLSQKNSCDSLNAFPKNALPNVLNLVQHGLWSSDVFQSSGQRNSIDSLASEASETRSSEDVPESESVVNSVSLDPRRRSFQAELVNGDSGSESPAVSASSSVYSMSENSSPTFSSASGTSTSPFTDGTSQGSSDKNRSKSGQGDQPTRLLKFQADSQHEQRREQYREEAARAVKENQNAPEGVRRDRPADEGHPAFRTQGSTDQQTSKTAISTSQFRRNHMNASDLKRTASVPGRSREFPGTPTGSQQRTPFKGSEKSGRGSHAKNFLMRAASTQSRRTVSGMSAGGSAARSDNGHPRPGTPPGESARSAVSDPQLTGMPTSRLIAEEGISAAMDELLENAPAKSGSSVPTPAQAPEVQHRPDRISGHKTEIRYVPAQSRALATTPDSVRESKPFKPVFEFPEGEFNEATLGSALDHAFSNQALHPAFEIQRPPVERSKHQNAAETQMPKPRNVLTKATSAVKRFFGIDSRSSH